MTSKSIRHHLKQVYQVLSILQKILPIIGFTLSHACKKVMNNDLL